MSLNGYVHARRSNEATGLQGLGHTIGYTLKSVQSRILCSMSISGAQLVPRPGHICTRLAVTQLSVLCVLPG